MEAKNIEKPTELCKKQELVEKGLPVDWLVRAHACHSMETLLYLFEQRQKWIDEDQNVILTVLQDYHASGGGLITENTPANRFPQKRAYFGDDPEVFQFTCQLLDMIKEEGPIWDKSNCDQFGFHQPMRQSWCGISLKLGGWGAMEHVQMLKSIYRRRRDQYNIDHLRGGKPFLYSEKLEFLKNLLETSQSDTPTTSITLQEHIDALEPKIDLEAELRVAPKAVQDILSSISSRIDQIASTRSPEALAQYLSQCCNQVVAHREHLAMSGLFDEMDEDFEDP